MCVYMYVQARVCVRVCMYVYVYMYVCMYVYSVHYGMGARALWHEALTEVSRKLPGNYKESR